VCVVLDHDELQSYLNPNTIVRPVNTMPRSRCRCWPGRHVTGIFKTCGGGDKMKPYGRARFRYSTNTYFSLAGARTFTHDGLAACSNRRNTLEPQRHLAGTGTGHSDSCGDERGMMTTRRLTEPSRQYSPLTR